jgi:hypothetical protein
MAAKLGQELGYLLQETGRDQASLLAEAVQEGIHTLFCRYVRDAYIEGKLSRRKAVRLLGASVVNEMDAAWQAVAADVRWGMKGE